MKNLVLLFAFFQSDVREANSQQRSRRKALVPLWSIFSVAAEDRAVTLRLCVKIPFGCGLRDREMEPDMGIKNELLKFTSFPSLHLPISFKSPDLPSYSGKNVYNTLSTFTAEDSTHA